MGLRRERLVRLVSLGAVGVGASGCTAVEVYGPTEVRSASPARAFAANAIFDWHEHTRPEDPEGVPRVYAEVAPVDEAIDDWARATLAREGITLAEADTLVSAAMYLLFDTGLVRFETTYSSSSGELTFYTGDEIETFWGDIDGSW